MKLNSEKINSAILVIMLVVFVGLLIDRIGSLGQHYKPKFRISTDPSSIVMPENAP